jgi:hypothetical protein
VTYWPSPPGTVSASELITSVGFNKHTDMGIHVKQRLDGLTPYTSSDAGTIVYGQVLVQDASSGARKFKKSAASAGSAGPYFVALDQGAIVPAGTGYAAHIGHVDLLYTGATPVAGDLLQASGSAGLAMVGSTNPFATAYATGLGGVVQAMLYGLGSAGGGGGGGSGSNATWDPYGNAVAPTATDFSVHDHWSGSGILTRLDQNTDNMVFYNPCAVSTIERGAFVPTSVPSPPYTVTACFVPNLVEIDYCSVALCLRASGSDKRIILRLYHDTTLKLGDLYFDDYQTLTSGSGTPSGALGWTQGFPIWLRFRDNASNMFYEYSRDGENWVNYQTKATGVHATMNQAGITMDSFTGGSGSAFSMTVLSFAVVNTA